MKCLVTGGAGFIGSHLCEQLLKNGHDVVCVDNLSTGKLKNVPAKADFIRADVNTPEISKLFASNKFGWVFHYAAVVGVRRTLENERQVMKDYEGIKLLANLSLASGVKKFVFASSSEVYGNASTMSELRMPYAKVKLDGEEYLKKCKGLNTKILRFFNVYGPRQIADEYGFVTGIFINHVINDKRPVIFGDGTQTRDFVYVKDNIKASLKAIESQENVFDIGTGITTTVLELAENIIDICRKNFAPDFIKSPYPDIMHRVAKPDALNSIGFKPEYSLSEGLTKTIKWYKEQNEKKS